MGEVCELQTPAEEIAVVLEYPLQVVKLKALVGGFVDLVLPAAEVSEFETPARGLVELEAPIQSDVLLDTSTTGAIEFNW